MNFEQEELKTQFYTAIREALPSDVKILYICIIGSQAKNLASADSDYDVRVIITNPCESYVLQRPQQTIRLDTTFQGKPLEGTAIDIIKAFEYALETNLFMTEILRGIPIYESPEKLYQQFKSVLLEANLSTVTLHSLQGKVYFYLKKYLKDKDGHFFDKVAAKVGVETIFLVLELRCSLAGKNIIDHPTFEALKQYLTEEETLFVSELVEIRRRNKNEKIAITEEIKAMIQDVLDKSQSYIKSFPKKETEKIQLKKESLKREVDKLCLNVILSR